MRYTLVIYDISDNSLRLRVSEVCKDFGLVRIQKSAFLGPLTGARRKELVARLRRLLAERGGPRDNVQVFCLDESSARTRVVIGSVEVVEGEGLLAYV